MSIGSRIRSARIDKGLSQWQLAELVGVEKQSTISKWENDKQIPERDYHDRLAEALGVRKSRIFYGDEEEISSLNGKDAIRSISARRPRPSGDGSRPSGDGSHPPDEPVAREPIARETSYGGVGPLEVSASDPATLTGRPDQSLFAGPTAYQAFERVPRFDAACASGPGSMLDPGAPPLGHHLFEREHLKELTGAPLRNLAVLRVRGDAMAPSLSDGDWVLLDRGQTALSQEGVYAMRVGETVWLKRLSLTFETGQVRVLSDNPVYDAQEIAPADLRLVGRAVAIVAKRL